MSSEKTLNAATDTRDGMRTRKQNGSTCINLPDAMEIYSTEMAEIDCCNKALLCWGGMKFDMERSYVRRGGARY